MTVFRGGARISAALLALLLGAGSSSAEYLLQAGDTLRVSILGHESLQRDALVGVDGTILLPLLGEITAEGKTLADVRDEVVSGYSGTIYRTAGTGTGEEVRTIDPATILVEMASYRPVHVLGDVNNPGEIAFRPGISVLQAVAGAGGLGNTIEVSEGNEIAILRLQGEANTLKRQIALDRDTIAQMRADVRDMMPGSEDGAGESATNGELDSWNYARRRARELRDEQTQATVQRLENRLEILEAQEDGAMRAVELDAGRVEDLEKTAELRHVDEQTLLQARQALVLSTSRALEVSAERGDIEVELSRLTLADGIADQLEIARALDEIRRMENQLQISLMELQGIATQIEQLGIKTPDLIADPIYAIFRDGPEGWTEISAEPQVKLEPGDVVEVRLVYRTELEGLESE